MWGPAAICRWGGGQVGWAALVSWVAYCLPRVVGLFAGQPSLGVPSRWGGVGFVGATGGVWAVGQGCREGKGHLCRFSRLLSGRRFLFALVSGLTQESTGVQTVLAPAFVTFAPHPTPIKPVLSTLPGALREHHPG